MQLRLWILGAILAAGAVGVGSLRAADEPRDKKPPAPPPGLVPLPTRAAPASTPRDDRAGLPGPARDRTIRDQRAGAVPVVVSRAGVIKGRDGVQVFTPDPRRLEEVQRTLAQPMPRSRPAPEAEKPAKGQPGTVIPRSLPAPGGQ